MPPPHLPCAPLFNGNSHMQFLQVACNLISGFVSFLKVSFCFVRAQSWEHVLVSYVESLCPKAESDPCWLEHLFLPEPV